VASPEPARRGPHWILLGAIVVAVLVADQLSKNWAINSLTAHPRDLVWGFRFFLTYNSGMAFSQGQGRGPIVGVIAIGVSAIVIYTLRSDRTVLGAVSRGLIVGGACGNVLDRLFRAQDGFMSGRVVDFVDPGFWPVFNVADSAVVIGCILLVVNLLFQGGPDDDERGADGSGDAATPDDVAGQASPSPSV
jgi:signal peptidase II